MLTSGPEFEARAKEVASWTPVQLYVRGLITTDELAEEAPGTTEADIEAAHDERDAQEARKARRNNA